VEKKNQQEEAKGRAVIGSSAGGYPERQRLEGSSIGGIFDLISFTHKQIAGCHRFVSKPA
jgi:hypothetical protein